PIEGEVSELEEELIGLIKTTGMNKDYELVEYVNDVNREHAEVLMELNINGIMDTAYSYGDQRLTNERFTGWTGYYTYDPRGSVSGVTDADGYIWQSYRYNANGDITFGKPQYNNVYSYNAESYNPNFESQYLRARYYNVANANFLTEDSYLGKITDPLSLNRYNYVKSSPLNYVDPSGHFAFTPDTAFDIASWLASSAEFMANPTVGNALSLAWDTFAVAAPGVPSVGLMDDAAEFLVKETGEKITKKAVKEAAEKIAKEGLEESIENAAKKNLSGSCAKYTDEILKGFSKVDEIALHHSSIGEFTFDPRTGALSKMKGGGHGQANIDFLNKNGMEYNIVKEYANGVRIGNIPDHKTKIKRTGTNQSWFPKSWSESDISKAGEYVGNLSENVNAADGVVVFGEYKGVRVGVIRTNGKISTIFPDAAKQP
ncbi:MAG: EndoU domain-containing protein, partial [Lachnospiraceae bacterium]|nr:EndoU domain-containing protein [Lachnospiraceae bacterium]